MLQNSPKFMKKQIPEDFDISTLVQISEGYTCAAIVKVVKSVLTERRVERLDKRPLKEFEFINALSCSVVWPGLQPRAPRSLYVSAGFGAPVRR